MEKLSPYPEINAALKQNVKEEKAPKVEVQEEQLLTGREFEYFYNFLEEIGTPIASGRSTIPTGTNLYQMVNEAVMASPKFKIEFLDVIEELGMWNADVSNAIENISMANTEHQIYFDEKVPDELRNEMIAECKRARKFWYNFSDGYNGLNNDFLAQAAITGAVSFEAIPNMALDGISNVVLVSPKSIVFKYDNEDFKYKPYQKKDYGIIGPNQTLVGGQFIELNEVTYRYVGMRRMGDSPYAVPPFLSALEAISVQNDMRSNIRSIMEKLGLLGFLKVLFDKPIKGPNDTDSSYRAKLNNYLAEQLPLIKKGYKNGYMAGYREPNGGAPTIEMANTTTNVTGAEKLVEMNDTILAVGLKTDPAMQGRGTRTTETFGRVILKKFSTQLRNYQFLLNTSWAHIYGLHLYLKGFNFDNIEVEHESVTLGDQAKEEQAFGAKIKNAAFLYDRGIIDKDGEAQMAGYDEADQEETRVGNSNPAEEEKEDPDDKGGTKKTDPDQNKKKLHDALKALRAGLREYDYGQGCPEGCDHHRQSESFASDDAEKFWEDYNRAINKKFDEALNEVVPKIVNNLKDLSKGASQAEVEAAILANFYASWPAQFGKPIEKVVSKFVEEAYTFFRSEKTALAGLSTIPEPTMELFDFRAIEYFKRSDNLYLGKFVTDDDTRKRMVRWIREKYLEENIPIGKDSPGIRLFEREFKDFWKGESWKARRIIDTTVNHMRAFGNVNYMSQAAVIEYRISTVADKIRCPYCESMQGKLLDVQFAKSRFEDIISGDPADVPNKSPFITSLDITPDQIERMTKGELQSAGVGPPPYHGHCRCRTVAEI